MAVDNAQVKKLYLEDKLTMQQIADRLGVTKARIHQILQDSDVDTSHGAVPRPKPPRPARAEKVAYRAYQMTERTQELIELLHEALEETRAALVTRAIEELADRHLPNGRNTRLAASNGEGDAEAKPKGRRRAAAAAASPAVEPVVAAEPTEEGTAKPAGRRRKRKE